MVAATTFLVKEYTMASFAMAQPVSLTLGYNSPLYLVDKTAVVDL